jgi:hypothetical protein
MNLRNLAARNAAIPFTRRENPLPGFPPLLPTRMAPALLLLMAGLAFASPAMGAEDPRDRPYPHGDWQEDCNLCHRDEQWLPIQPTKEFSHAKRFPLEGAHRTASCRACHKTLEFDKNRGRSGCVNCHQDIHRGEFGLDCSRCHTPRSFIDRANMVRSHRTSRFPLTGAHVTADCEACHRPQPQGAMSYLSLPTECADCHFNPSFTTATQRPPASRHPDATDCEACHRTTGFDTTSFNHAGTGFALTGHHTSLSCTDCHGAPFNPNLNPACYSCHRSDYEAQKDPNHVVAGFDHDCTLCHNTTAFSGARFTQHDGAYFPIYGGTHAGRWDRCSDCHTSSAVSYSIFSCFQCHSQYDTGIQHSGMEDYIYDSQACYRCHPRGVAP